MKYGLSIKLDVTKIVKERLFKGEKGTYIDLTTFIDTEEKDQYDNNGFIAQSVDKEERDAGIKTPILGNVKVFYTSESGGGQPGNPPRKAETQPNAFVDSDLESDGLPF